MQYPIYLDYAATTPVDPRVASAMAECLTIEANFGNPASRSHQFGWKAEEAVENARRNVADLVNCDPREIVWTSGATEADNLALVEMINEPVESKASTQAVLQIDDPAETFRYSTEMFSSFCKIPNDIIIGYYHNEFR